MTMRDNGAPRRLRVFAIDESEEFLKALEFLLKLDPEVDVDYRTTWDKNGLSEANRMQADLVLMDLAAPISNGIDAIRKVKSFPHAPKVIVLTMHDQSDYSRAAIMAGADEFISKSQVGTQLPALIRSMFPKAK